jgi:hypothetical protein
LYSRECLLSWLLLLYTDLIRKWPNILHSRILGFQLLSNYVDPKYVLSACSVSCLDI